MNIGYSSTGMPVVYFLPNRNYLPLQQRSVNTAFFHIERAMDLLVNGQSQIMVLFYFGGKRQGAPATVQITKELISTFAEYYPECLGRSILMSIPWWMKAFLHIVWPFVDSHTKSKVRWISGERAIREGEIPACELLEDCGGNLELPYEQHQDYLATLIGIALTRREEQYRAWLDLGPPSVGRSERDFRVPPATRSINQLKHSLTDESFE